MNKIFLLGLVLLLLSCSKQEQLKSSQRFYRLSTVIDVIIYDDTVHEEKTWNKVDSLLLDWEERFSPQKEGSEIYQINHRQSDTIVISNRLCNIIKTTQIITKEIDTLFDLTVMPLKEFWQPENSCDTCNLPSPSTAQKHIDSLMTSIGMHNIVLQNDTLIFLNSATTIDVGGVAKGYVLQNIKTLLTNLGISNFLINAGGDVLAAGNKPQVVPFTVGIQQPRDTEGFLATFPLVNMTVVTSGDYERFRIAADGQRVHHIFNAKTGFPAQHNQSVTVLTDNPISADIFSTAFFALSPAEILTSAQQFIGVDVMVVDSSGDIHTTENFPN